MKTIREQLIEEGKLREKEIQEGFILGVPGTGKDVYILDKMKREFIPDSEFIINAADYKWIRILPDNKFEDCVDAIWCHKEDEDIRPVNINDKIEYRKFNPYEYPGPSAIGTVIAIFESIGPVDKRDTYSANRI